MITFPPRISKPKSREERENLPSLFYIRGVGVGGEVAAAFYPDVVDVAAVVWRGGSTGAELTGEQVVDVLQLQALCLREAGKDEEESQNCQARVHEERSWKRDSRGYIEGLEPNIRFYRRAKQMLIKLESAADVLNTVYDIFVLSYIVLSLQNPMGDVTDSL